LRISHRYVLAFLGLKLYLSPGWPSIIECDIFFFVTEKSLAVGTSSNPRCRLVVLFSKSGHDAATDAPFFDVWRTFYTSSHDQLKETCDVYEFDARSDPVAVLDVVTNFISPSSTSIIVGIGDFGLTEDLKQVLQNTSTVVYSPQSRIPFQMPAVFPSANQRQFKTRVDAVLAKTTAMGFSRVLPVVCDVEAQEKQFKSFLEAISKDDFQILPPVVAVSASVVDVDKDSVVLAFCGSELPSALLWAKLTSPRLLTRPWLTLDAVDYPELSDNDVVSKQVGPSVGLFTPVVKSAGKEECQKFLTALPNIVRRQMSGGTAKEIDSGDVYFPTDESVNDVPVAWIPLLSRKSGRAVMVRSLSWSVDSFISFSRKDGKLGVDDVKIPTLGQVTRSGVEKQLRAMRKSCDSFWISVHAADPLAPSGSVSTETFFKPGVDVGVPETLVFLMDKFRGDVVCFREDVRDPTEKLSIILKCEPGESICKRMILSDVHYDGRPKRALKAFAKSETAHTTRTLLNRLGQYVQATSPCLGSGLFCVICLDVAGRYVTDITMTSCAAACLTVATTSCIGFVFRESGAVLRQTVDLIT
jgi:hypothetical protein